MQATRSLFKIAKNLSNFLRTFLPFHHLEHLSICLEHLYIWLRTYLQTVRMCLLCMSTRRETMYVPYIIYNHWWTLVDMCCIDTECTDVRNCQCCKACNLWLFKSCACTRQDWDNKRTMLLVAVDSDTSDSEDD